MNPATIEWSEIEWNQVNAHCPRCGHWLVAAQTNAQPIAFCCAYENCHFLVLDCPNRWRAELYEAAKTSH